jgi:GNAT superfamily N-acetyltransferase
MPSTQTTVASRRSSEIHPQNNLEYVGPAKQAQAGGKGCPRHPMDCGGAQHFHLRNQEGVMIEVVQAAALPSRTVSNAIQRLYPQMPPRDTERIDIAAAALLRDRKDQRNCLFLALTNGETVGILTLNIVTRIIGITAWINQVVVDENHRNEGVCKALVARALCYAKEAGVTQIYLHTEHQNIAAHHVYHSFGFTSEPRLEFTLQC